MPMLPGEWYVKQLRQRYRDIVIPFERHDGRSGTMKALIDANPGRPIAIIGKPLDESAEGSYWSYPYGLVSLVEPMAKDITLSQTIADNEQLFRRYKPPSPDEIKSKTFERRVLTHYAATALVLGRECENARLYSEARKWFERAVVMDPNLVEAQQALARVEKAK